MEASLRIEKLKEIVDKRKHYAQKELFYRNQPKTMDVYEIPLNCLIYNQYNGRIATFVKTHETQYGPIDATTPENEKLIEGFLWESKINRNKTTQDDLLKKGQLEYGIVTADGVVIDGNRRFMLLRRNAEKNNAATEYFKAVILDDTLESNPKEIMRLETTYQMGVDDKVDYNPIQKYLKCRDLKNKGFTEAEIAKMMGEKSAKIKEYLLILELMDEYLAKCGYEGMYRILETEKLEGHFTDLNNYLSRYKSGHKIQGMEWSPEKEDIDDVKNIYFDYIRADFGVHDIREIANPAKDKGVFTQKSLWKIFSDKHFSEMNDIKDKEESLQEMRDKIPNIDVIRLITARDKDFNKKADGKLKGNLRRTKNELEDQNKKDAPLELLQKAKKTLDAINTDVESFNCQEVKGVSHDIRKIVEKFIKIVDGKA